MKISLSNGAFCSALAMCLAVPATAQTPVQAQAQVRDQAQAEPSAPLVGLPLNGSSAPQDFSGVWMRTRSDPNRPGQNWASTPLYLQDIPYTPAAKEQFEKRDPTKDPGIFCVQSSMPRMMIAPYPTQIYQWPDHILVINEANSVIRRIWLDRKEHLAELVPTYHGDSIGRWEGKTLVVDTIGFNDRNNLDQGGSRMSANLHTVERWTVTEGPPRQLKVEFTFEDSTIYTRPWKSVVVYDSRPGMKLAESVCNDNPRDFLLTEKAGKPRVSLESLMVE